MTQTPDLTKSLEELEIHAEDDGTTARKARENRNGVDTSSTDHSTLTTLESPSQLVPELLLRHSDALLAALSASFFATSLPRSIFSWLLRNVQADALSIFGVNPTKRQQWLL
jgi:hypothetical protein